MKLSNRLEKVLEMAPSCETAADIGTDHGFTPIELVRRGIARRAIAADVRPGPLKAAAEHIAEAGLDECIETRLGDGLSCLTPGEAQLIVMTGMGGPLMERILTEGLEQAKSAGRLVLSPQSELPHFRAFLEENGFAADDEDMVEEDGKFYNIMLVKYGGEKKMTPEELLFGRPLLQKRPPVLLDYLRREKEIALDVLEQLKGLIGVRYDGRRAALTERLAAIDRVLSE